MPGSALIGGSLLWHIENERNCFMHGIWTILSFSPGRGGMPEGH
ncbi:Uncharacterised protein [Serratia proteamaculans]|nr:Uncharacterised protein [Serratia proteamaculans]